MLWGCFLWNGVGPLVKMVGNKDATYYVCNWKLYTEEEMPLRWGFQLDNDPEHMSKKAKEGFRSHKIV